MEFSPYWWKIDLKGRNYQAVQKQIKRAGAEYIALGTGPNTTIFVNKKLDNTEIVAFQKLADSIEDILKQPSAPGERRFKHSRGLFPADENPETNIHLKRKVMVNENIRKLMERFSSKWYTSNAGSGGYYVDLGEDAETVLDKVLSEIKSKVEYQTVYKNAEQHQETSEANEADE